MEKRSPNLIVITGPTATGKTRIAAKLAFEIDGEIISADSRQVYRGLDIGTGKDLKEYLVEGKRIPYHLIDIVEPGYEFNVFEFQNRFHECFSDIVGRRKMPILAGGTGLYIDAVIRGYRMAEVPENSELRKKLELLDMETLERRLRSGGSVLHNTTDLTSKKRLIRAIEIAEYTRQYGTERSSIKRAIHPLVIGIYDDRETIRKRIADRLHGRLAEGMVGEVERLHTEGVSWEKLDFLGLEYRYVGRYLQGTLAYDEMVGILNTRINQFSKRQMTWFRRMGRLGVSIHWVKAGEYGAVRELVATYCMV